MRRSTAGVIDSDALVPRKIARIEREDPERVIRLLEPLVLERRRARILEVIARAPRERDGRLRCAARSVQRRGGGSIVRSVRCSDAPRRRAKRNVPDRGLRRARLAKMGRRTKSREREERGGGVGERRHGARRPRIRSASSCPKTSRRSRSSRSSSETNATASPKSSPRHARVASAFRCADSSTA